MASFKFFMCIIVCLIPNAFSFWTSCPNGRPPISVTSPSCGADRCTVVRGDRILMTIRMDFLEAHATLRPRATAFFLGIGIQVPDVPGHDDVCPHLVQANGNSRGCPVIPNVPYDWVIDMIVPNTIPAFNNGRMRVEILDGTRVVSCFEAIGAMI